MREEFAENCECHRRRLRPSRITDYAKITMNQLPRAPSSQNRNSTSRREREREREREEDCDSAVCRGQSVCQSVSQRVSLVRSFGESSSSELSRRRCHIRRARSVTHSNRLLTSSSSPPPPKLHLLLTDVVTCYNGVQLIRRRATRTIPLLNYPRTHCRARPKL